MCDDRERLIEYIYGECDSAERREIDDHLAGCPECRIEIGALRHVRQDLLAWDVPEQRPVWRPVAPAQPAHWATRLSGWALAAAAGLVLMVGGAGGAVTAAYLNRQVPAGTVAAASSAEGSRMVPARTETRASAVSQADLDALEQRLVSRFQPQLDQVRLVAAHASSQADDSVPELKRQVRALQQAQSDFSQAVYADMSRLYRERQRNSRANDYVTVSFPGPSGR